MNSLQLAELSTLSLYAAMAVLAAAMLAFAVYLARLPRLNLRSQAPALQEERVLVGAGGPRAPQAQEVAASDGSSSTPSKRSTPAGSMAMSLTWLGGFLLVATLLFRGLSVMRVPVANLFEFSVSGATATLLVYLFVAMRKPLRWLGMLVVIVVESILGIALVSWYVPAAELAPALDSYWIAIHVPIAIISIGIFTVACAVIMGQMVVERRERKRAAAGGELKPSIVDAWPSSDRLDRIAYSLHVAAMPLWTFTIIAGAIWGQKAWGTYWSWDPKEVWSFVIWALYAAYLHARATSGWKRSTANIIAIAGYVAIILNVTVVNLFFTGLHAYSGVQ